MINLKPCPFCGSEVQDDPHTGEKYPRKSPMGGWIIHCECCGASLSQFRKSGKGEISWNTRPIEDELQSRIAELEKDLSNKEIEYTDLWDDALALQARIAELEAESERFTVHSRIKRQDDKWIPVSERLPEKQKLTIGFTDNSAYVFFEIVNDDEMGLVMYPYQNRKGTVTHWMPLPSTPEVQE